jgi:ribosome recycling factor
MIKEAVTEYRQKMDKVLEDLGHAFASVRTGRASLALVDGIQAEAYGTHMPLKQMASLSTPDARTIAIQPFDSNMIGPIEKALLASDLGITPNNDGRIIRLTIPQLTEDRRKELVKLTKKYAEEHRVSIRQLRHHFNDVAKKLEKDHAISEDDLHTELEKFQKMTDEYVAKIDEVLKHKDAEIMEV